MKKSAAVFYGLAALTVIFYVTVSLLPTFTPSPYLRLLLLVCTCVLVYMGSLMSIKGAEYKAKEKTMKRTFTVIFILYLVLITTLVLFDSYFGRVGHIGFRQWNKDLFCSYVSNSMNLIPFATVGEYVSALIGGTMNLHTIFINLAGNLFAFSPLGFFLPLLWKKQKHFGIFVLTVAAAVTAVELLQFLLLVGSCDIDDLILNTLGAMCAFGILHIPAVKKVVDRITYLNY